MTVEKLTFLGANTVSILFRTAKGNFQGQMLFRDDESALSLVEKGRPWSFDADGASFRLGAEANRIRMAHLFDPLMAVHTSNVEPLPHQITAVYEAMLSKQPLRFLPADAPGAGKTIMAGLLIRELMVGGGPCQPSCHSRANGNPEHGSPIRSGIKCHWRGGRIY